jgi:hypothetical protein
MSCERYYDLVEEAILQGLKLAAQDREQRLQRIQEYQQSKQQTNPPVGDPVASAAEDSRCSAKPPMSCERYYDLADEAYLQGAKLAARWRRDRIGPAPGRLN